MEKIINRTYSKIICNRNIDARLMRETIGIFAMDNPEPLSIDSRITCLSHIKDNFICCDCDYKPKAPLLHAI